AMGWQTIKGGYELRNPIGKFGLAPKGITFLQGTHHHQACHVFEGLFDCLAWLTARNQPQADVDCLILNSTALVNQAVTWLNAQAHADIFLWCDNDPTGDKATTFLINQLEITSATQRQIKDMRPHYRGHKDVNDWWLGKARPPSP
ncbi:MAG TPA: hypothetical protein DCR93_30755, partial [Cytophagales bacterium]|nr:hypothetical protein [Cytophagales bacterium]